MITITTFNVEKTNQHEDFELCTRQTESYNEHEGKTKTTSKNKISKKKLNDLFIKKSAIALQYNKTKTKTK